jgi:hypothetical protein
MEYQAGETAASTVENSQAVASIQMNNPAASGGGSGEFKELPALTEEGQTGLDETMRLVEEQESRLRRIASKLLDLRGYSDRVEKEMETVVDMSATNMKTADRVNKNTVELHSKMAGLSHLAEPLGRMAEDRTRAATEGI